MRLKYIDCLRGAAMFMVVYSHIMSFCLTGYAPSPLGAWMRAVMLPLFFFISGYVSYKAVPKTGIAEYGKQVWKKTQAMLIPTMLMMTLMMLYSGNNMLEFLFRYDKGGYWFTWVLFQIVIVYLPFLMLTKRVQQPFSKALLLLLPYALMMAIFRFVGFESSAAVLFEWVKVKGYYMFFALGAITCLLNLETDKLPVQALVRLARRNANLAPTLLLAVSVALFCRIGGGDLTLQILPVCLMYFSFKALEPWLSADNNRVAEVMSTIGRYTLPIYLMHFFLLFRLPASLSNYLMSLQSDTCFGTHSCCSLVEFLLVGSLSVLICYACIVITNLIKQISTPVARWFLGIR